MIEQKVQAELLQSPCKKAAYLRGEFKFQRTMWITATSQNPSRNVSRSPSHRSRSFSPTPRSPSKSISPSKSPDKRMDDKSPSPQKWHLPSPTKLLVRQRMFANDEQLNPSSAIKMIVAEDSQSNQSSQALLKVKAVKNGGKGSNRVPFRVKAIKPTTKGVAPL